MEAASLIECQDTPQCNATEVSGLNQEKRNFLVEVNLMLQKFQDFVSVLISNPNVLPEEGAKIIFPVDTEICTTVCKNEETEDSLCLEISGPQYGFRG